MKFDVILSNAPYDKGLHEKFEDKYFNLCDGQIVWVSPLSFLLGKKQNKKITLELDKYKTDIEQINGYEYFDAAIGGTMGIVYVDMNIDNQGVTFDGKKYEKCKEITQFSNDELLVSVKDKIGCGHLSDNIHEHVLKYSYGKYFSTAKVVKEDDIPNNYWCIRLRAVYGHPGTGDFYTILTKKPFNELCGQYDDISKRTMKDSNTKTVMPFMTYFIAFKNKNQCINCFNYLHSDFVRICLYFIKTSMNLCNGELKYVPWQDFTKEWTDEKLFKKYGITKEEIQHIYDILPNYYGIERINLDEYEL